MNTTSSLKVTVNGKKYLITGIQNKTSCKDLLCAIAKATKNSRGTTVRDGKKSEEKSLRGLYGVQNSEIKCEENLLEQFKGDVKKVGDFESLKIFNSLGNGAKIISHEKLTIQKDIAVDECSHIYKSRKKKKRIKEEKHTIKLEERKKDLKKSLKLKHTKHFEKTHSHDHEKKHSKSKQRSLDDSDIDNYKQKSITRLKKRKGIAYDDSDIDIYKGLVDIVVGQKKTLSELKKQSKEVRKTAWIEELQKSSQIYHFNDKTDTPESQMSKDKDDEHDSGLPSPEYDSSESQEVQPITPHGIQTQILKDNTIYPERATKDKQFNVSTQNTSNNKQTNINDNLPNKNYVQRKLSSNVTQTTTNMSKDLSNNVVNFNVKEEYINSNGYTKSRKDDLKSDLESGRSEVPMSTITFTDKISLSLNDLARTNNNYKSNVDDNKNIISRTIDEEEASRKMVAFDAALLQQKTFSSLTKKSDKKKIKKAQISDPLLLSPSAFQRHKISKKASLILGVDTTADVLRREIILQQERASKKTFTDKKDKEKFYNKKLKEIRKAKELKTKSSEPEYSTKTTFAEDKNNNKNLQEAESVFELNVFEKKNKQKFKIKKIKRKGSKSKINGFIERDTENTTDTNKLSVITDKNTVAERDSSNLSTVRDVAQRRARKTHKVSDKEKQTENNDDPETDLNKDCIAVESVENDVSDTVHHIFYEEKGTSRRCSQTPKTEEGEGDATNISAFSSTIDEFSESSSLSSMSNCRVSIASCTSEAQTTTELPNNVVEIEKHDIFQQYEEEINNLNALTERLLDYNLLILKLSEELEILSFVESCSDTDSDLEEHERQIMKEIENVKSLLRSVSDLTSYQRREMSENLAMLNKLDLDVRTKKAGYTNLKSGAWKTSSQSAPRWLVKKRHSQTGTNKARGSSFV